MNLSIAFGVLTIIHQICAARILFLIPFSGRSHYINMLPIVQELDRRGHELTVICPYEEKNVNYTQIITRKLLIWELMGKDQDMFNLEEMTPTNTVWFCFKGMLILTRNSLESENLKEFIANDNSHFDLIFTELFYQEAFYMFAHKYKAPIVGFSTMGLPTFTAAIMGNPIIPSYMVHEFMPAHKGMTFWERMQNFIVIAYDLVLRKYMAMPMQQEMAEEFFSSLPKPLPQLEDIERNMSVALISTHFSYDLVRPYVPGIVEVGGVHIKKVKPLPQDIKKFLDEAKHGAIFFSLGSNIQSANMPKDKLKLLLNVFKSLKQRVLWKWEDEHLPGKSNNVMIGKWLPQSDILAHPNVKLFITHGGLLSTQESMYHGVPVIGLPFYADQHVNVERLQNYGFGLKLMFSELTEEKLLDGLNKVLNDPSFKKNAEDLSRRFRDRPMTALETSIFWIEYVIRNKGAPFMRSPALDMSFFALNMLDVIAFGIACVTIALILLCKVFKCIFMRNRTPLSTDKKDD